MGTGSSWSVEPCIRMSLNPHNWWCSDSIAFRIQYILVSVSWSGYATGQGSFAYSVEQSAASLAR